MIKILNLTRAGFKGESLQVKVNLTFNENSTLPEKTISTGDKTYLIAEGSVATNTDTKTSYKFTNDKWVKTAYVEIPEETIDSNVIKVNGNYNISNNDSIGFADVVVDVPGDIPSVLTTKTITSNGIYKAEDDNVEGYSVVTANVPNTYTSSDEGKVVSNGTLVGQTSTNITSNGTVNTTLNNEVVVDVANTYTSDDNGKVVSNQELVAQTAYPTTVTQNDTYDTTDYNSITINVSGGGGGNATLTTEDDEFDYISNYANLLKSIEIPNSVTSIGGACFNYCNNLETVTFESNSSLVTIGDDAFNYCISLSSITIPDGVTSIGEGAFYDCENLETVEFELNSSLESIGENAFFNCSSLTSITIPDSVTSIGHGAFYNCQLSSITFEPTTPPTLDEDLGIDTRCTIWVPRGTLSAYTSAPNYPDPNEYTYEEY